MVIDQNATGIHSLPARTTLRGTWRPAIKLDEMNLPKNYRSSEELTKKSASTRIIHSLHQLLIKHAVWTMSHNNRCRNIMYLSRLSVVAPTSKSSVWPSTDCLGLKRTDSRTSTHFRTTCKHSESSNSRRRAICPTERPKKTTTLTDA